ncbi:hypothetical protein E2562_020895 [Oryza meyeriana var. granulata]|uniref:Uncharacterized protein n=1 Tax=Oryza meyeriana var. granulata TaxID=110450 RepID=A0A6G1D626_9ORYZ|nr:hypothetical protein E2562_020895 [Oryza meyeriana var. granulata]
MEDSQITFEYYLAEHTPLPSEYAGVVEEAESSTLARGAHGGACRRRRGRGRGAVLREVDAAMTSTSRSTRHRYRSAKRSRRRPRAVHQPIEEVEDGGTTLGEVEAVAARMAGEVRDG